ncbi:helix-turn-helix domain-containing protein [Candidatus Endomicrobiellum devescovinae]|jgi:cytoskeletal protein RodZ|uniref:helix-turn-helix domain-containing protein n=1 Tax=Candidatus Endomicrobiellum devescovinae TaxID=3242322 RepID=UPI00283A5B3E|nr:DUF4115 domain-containing protein [Endomicrobium sp.]
MKEIGKTLKDKREQMNLSLSDVHKATKVQEKYLAAIEEGDLDAFKDEVFYKSFLRSYSKYLGFDPEEFVELFNSQKREIERSPKSEEVSFCAVEKNIFNTKKIFIVVVAIIAVALLIIFVCLYRNMSKIAQAVESDNFKQIECESLPKEKIEDDATVMEQDEPYSEEKIPNAEASTRQNLEIEAKETVWIKVDIDGKAVYEGTLLKGGKKMWEVNNSFTLKLGYAPGVKVFFNGESVDVVSGAVQDVNTIILKKK